MSGSAGACEAVRFVELAEAALDDLAARRPQWASGMGEHRHDDRLDDWSPAAVAAELAVLRRRRAALAAFDTTLLAPADAFDAALLADLLDARVFALAQLRAHEWDPLVHLPGHAVHGLLARPFAPAADRLRALAGRLAALPDALATAAAVLSDPPRVHLETALEQTAGLASLVADGAEELLAAEPRMRRRLEPAQAAALAALERFREWLAARQSSGPFRDPRLGGPLWERQAAHVLSAELPPAALAAAAREHLDELSATIAEVAGRFLGEPPGPEVTRRAYDRLAADAGDDTTVLADAAKAFAEVSAATEACGLVSVLDEPADLVVMPPFARGVSVAYCDSPGPLEAPGQPTFLAIAPTPEAWTARRRASFYREYNRSMLRTLMAHEAVPGHHLQLSHARRYRGATRVRAAARSGTFVEGWAVYAEELLAGTGFGGDAVRLQQLKMQLRSTVNALLDAGVHSGELDREAAMALMTGPGLQEEGEAGGKWRRALLTAGQLSTYFAGYVEVSGLRRELGGSDRDAHGRMLAHGSPPPRYLKALLTR